MAFISKNWQKKASENGVNALCRVAGAGVSAAILQKMTADESTNLKKTIKNIAAPGLTVLAVLGDLMLEDEKLRAVCQGMYTYSALKAVAVVMPSIGENIGFNEAAPKMGAFNPNAEDADSNVSEVSGVIMHGTGQRILNGTQQALPPEIADAYAKQSKESKAFEDVASYIEKGADDAIKINGVSSATETVAESML